MPAGDPTASVQPWLITSEPEPLARAFGYVRPEPDAELGLLRQSRAIERVCRERGIALEGLLSDEPGAEWRPSSVQSAAGYKRPDRGRGLDGLPGNAALPTRTDALEHG